MALVRERVAALETEIKRLSESCNTHGAAVAGLGGLHQQVADHKQELKDHGGSLEKVSSFHTKVWVVAIVLAFVLSVIGFIFFGTFKGMWTLGERFSVCSAYDADDRPKSCEILMKGDVEPEKHAVGNSSVPAVLGNSK